MTRAWIRRLARIWDRAGDPRGGMLRSGQPVKRCSCGRAFSLAELLVRESGGIQYSENGQPELELFHCDCMSTFAVPVGLTRGNGLIIDYPGHAVDLLSITDHPDGLVDFPCPGGKERAGSGHE